MSHLDGQWSPVNAKATTKRQDGSGTGCASMPIHARSVVLVNSILPSDGCYICGNPDTEVHHIFFGRKNRQISDENGFTCKLCYVHHRGFFGVHGTNGHRLDLFLKKECQRKYEETHTRKEFMRLIGRNYLD